MFFKDQPVLSTREDSQGEKRTKEFLDEMVQSMPQRFPVGQHHDMGKQHCGYMQNFRVVPVPKADDEWMIIADIELDSGTVGEAIGGFSYGFAANYRQNADQVETAVYLPHPYYNNEQIINELLLAPIPLQVGKWHKKAVDPGRVALIVSFVLFVFGPAWQRIYDSRVYPFLVAAARKLTEIAIEPLEYHYGFHVRDNLGRPVAVYMIPAPHEALYMSQLAALKQGLEVAMKFIETDSVAKNVGLYLLKLRYDSNSHEFRIFSAQLLDGTVQWYDAQSQT